MPSPSDSCRLKVERAEDGAVVRLIGCALLDEESTPAVKDQLTDLAEELGPAALRLDLHGVRLLSSTGLGMIVALHRQLKGQGGQLTLCGVTAPLHEIFEVTLLTRVLDIRRDEAHIGKH